MGLEIGFQIQDLPLLRLHKGQKKCLFVGAGDSFAACLAAQFASGNRSLSCYPLDVVDNPSIADGRAIYIVSVSGKTRANILAAWAAKLRGFRTVAVTAEPDSPLAHSCDASIQLRFRRAQVTTAGTISFSASLVTCLSIATESRCRKNCQTCSHLQKGKLLNLLTRCH